MIAVILQARLDSRRLPGKALLPLAGEPVLFRVMEALRAVPAGAYVLACPEDSAGEFSPLAARAGFTLYAGAKDDVLARYRAAARRAGLLPDDHFVRATGDNPFVFADAAKSLLEETIALDADYAGYAGLPYGAGVEVLRASALFCADSEAFTPFEREHVCPYLYSHPETFMLHRPLAPRRWQGPLLRVTIDEKGDYEKALRLYDALTVSHGASPLRYTGEAIISAGEALLR